MNSYHNNKSIGVENRVEQWGVIHEQVKYWIVKLTSHPFGGAECKTVILLQVQAGPPKNPKIVISQHLQALVTYKYVENSMPGYISTMPH